MRKSFILRRRNRIFTLGKMKLLTRKTPFGKITIGSDGGFITLLAFGDMRGRDESDPLLRRAFAELGEYFEGTRREFDLPLSFNGTPFMKKVWRVLEKIGFGKTLTYGDIARAIGSPKAVRAVGSACGKNKICIFVPCHRVVASGGLGGFSAEGGVGLKRRLLDFERDVLLKDGTPKKPNPRKENSAAEKRMPRLGDGAEMSVGACSEEAMAHLSRVDAALAAVIEKRGKIERKRYGSAFECLVNAVVNQQISGSAAAGIWRKLGAALGHITPSSISGAGIGVLRSCGLSRTKAECALEIARKAATKEVDFDSLDCLGTPEIVKILTSIKGVGLWSAQMVLIFALDRRDVLSYGDLGIRRAIMKLHGLEKLPRSEFEKYAKLYAPYGTAASLYLWESSSV